MTPKPDYKSMLDAELASFIDPVTGFLSSTIARTIECPLCLGQDLTQEELFIKRGYRFVRCTACGLVFVNPQVNPSNNMSMYENSDSLKEWTRILQTHSQARFDMDVYNSIGAFSRPLIQTEKPDCLDISIRGGLLSECEAFSNWSFDFLDFSSPSRELGRTKYPGKIFYNGFDAVKSAGKTYDVIIAMEAIEHFSDPVVFARDVRSLLKDGGVFCGILSNLESLLVRLTGADAPMFDGLYQKFFFHSGSLEKLLDMVGFRDVTFHSVVPCSEKIKGHLNKMIPDHLALQSDVLIKQIAEFAETPLLGYKLIFAAKKEAL